MNVELLTEASGMVSLPSDLALKVGPVQSLFLEFGTRRIQAVLSEALGPPDHHLRMSKDLVATLMLPVDGSYRFRVSNRTLRLGPVVGLLAGKKSDDLTPARLQILANHLVSHHQPGGLILAFARDQIDVQLQTVRGYRFLDTQATQWEEGVFPLPRVVFRRFGVPLGPLLSPLHAMGMQIFNERTFNKWEFWQWASHDPEIRGHLPETVYLRQNYEMETITELLSKHRIIYVKPIWGSLGAGILRVQQTDTGFLADVSGNGRLAAGSNTDLYELLKPHLPVESIAQQGLKLSHVGNRLVDFRVVVQKDRFGDWLTTGIVGRCGTEALFLSNMATGGFPIPVAQCLSLLFGEAPVEIFRRKQELSELGIATARALEKGGLLLGDLGLDMAYDDDGHPWIIEANNRDPDHNIGWEAGSWPLFYRFRTLPTAYACFQDGFGEFEEAGKR